MHAKESPLFGEYLKLASMASWHEIVAPNLDFEIGPQDALIVVDMQNDFVPTDDINPQGGAFAVAEGNHIADLIVKMMDRFAASGASVVATRDYHPVDHCSFIPQGGPFPPHCVQGGVGSKFYKPIGECLKKLQNLGKNADVVFKGFHEDVDSFGAITYADSPTSWARVTNRQDGPAGLHGCTLASWTGAVKLKCSNCEEDIDAPPDILSAYRRLTLADLLKERNIKRVFACGLAMDFCVLDTTLNAAGAGFAECYLIMDAARAAHLPGIGSIGSGFLQDPADLKAKMESAGTKVAPASSLLPDLEVKNPLSFQEIGRVFPEGLGPWALIPAAGVKLALQSNDGKYTVQGPDAEVKSLMRYKVDLTGTMGPLSPITLDAGARRALQIPADAKNFAWGYPLGKGSFDDKTLGYFSITTPAAAFFVFGGFIYCDGQGQPVAVMAVSLGSGLQFGQPNKWKANYSSSLGKRWQPVTAPLLLKAGAKIFAWINPGESLKAGGGEPWVVCKHGAFAYLFHDDPGVEDERDVYFAIEDKSEPMKPSLGRVSHREAPSPKGEPNPEPSPTQKGPNVAEREQPASQQQCCTIS